MRMWSDHTSGPLHLYIVWPVPPPLPRLCPLFRILPKKWSRAPHELASVCMGSPQSIWTRPESWVKKLSSKTGSPQSICPQPKRWVKNTFTKTGSPQSMTCSPQSTHIWPHSKATWALGVLFPFSMPILLVSYPTDDMTQAFLSPFLTQSH